MRSNSLTSGSFAVGRPSSTGRLWSREKSGPRPAEAGRPAPPPRCGTTPRRPRLERQRGSGCVLACTTTRADEHAPGAAGVIVAWARTTAAGLAAGRRRVDELGAEAGVSSPGSRRARAPPPCYEGLLARLEDHTPGSTASRAASWRPAGAVTAGSSEMGGEMSRPLFRPRTRRPPTRPSRPPARARGAAPGWGAGAGAGVAAPLGVQLPPERAPTCRAVDADRRALRDVQRPIERPVLEVRLPALVVQARLQPRAACRPPSAAALPVAVEVVVPVVLVVRLVADVELVAAVRPR